MIVVGGSGPQALARGVARRLGARHARAGVRVFPDGELKATLPRWRGGWSAVVKSAAPPVDSSWMEIFSLVHAARARGPVVAVIPYMGYARQDREFLPGEAVTMGSVSRMLGALGAAKVVTVDIHSRAALRHLGRRGADVSAMPALAGRLRRMGLGRAVIVSPDAGGRGRAAALAGLLGTGHAALEKRRDRRTGRTRTARQDLDVSGRDAVIADDMISTGGSIEGAARLLRAGGARRIVAACTHALLVGDAERRIRRAGVSEIVSANTVRGTVDVSGPVAEAVRAAAG